MTDAAMTMAPAPPAEAPAALPRTWEEAFPRRPKPDGAEYGFLSARGEAVPSSRDTLLHLARTQSLPSLVWTPGSPTLVPPWEVEFIVDALREHLADEARRERRLVLRGYVALVAVSLVVSPIAGIGLAIGLAPLAGVLSMMITGRMEKARRTPAEHFRRGFDALVEARFEAVQPIPATHAIAIAIACVGGLQFLMLGPSIEAGAVSRRAVEAGEWWRLLTAPMLHGGFLHFWMNYGALESLGRVMETRGVRAFVPLVFVASALAGGVCSVLVPPDVPSVGASGGLMGMFGFLAVMGYRRRKQFPDGFLRRLLFNIALIGIVGVLAYRFIDNAAHAGGLLAGVLTGLAAIPGGDAEWTESRTLRLAGHAAHALVFLSAVLAVILTLAAVLG